MSLFYINTIPHVSFPTTIDFSANILPKEDTQSVLISKNSYRHSFAFFFSVFDLYLSKLLVRFSSIESRGQHFFDGIPKPESLLYCKTKLLTTSDILAKLHRLDIVISTCRAAGRSE